MKFNKLSNKEINKILLSRHVPGFRFYLLVIATTIVEGLTFLIIFDLIVLLTILTINFFIVLFFVLSRYSILTPNYKYRVMEYVNVIDDDEFLFSYKLYKKKDEIFVTRNEVLKIMFVNSADDFGSFNNTGRTFETTRKYQTDRGIDFAPHHMKLELVKFVKPKRYGYVEEITEYIIPEFFERQEELMEALHKLADNFEKMKQLN